MSSRGLFDSLRALLARLLDLAQTRIELLTTEIAADIQRAATILLWAFIALFFAGITVLMLAFSIVIALWDEHRLFAAALVCTVFLLVTLTAALIVHRKIRARPALLAESLQELRRDRDALRGQAANEQDRE